MTYLNKSIVFVGGKGGVGKSTSASSLAYRSALNNKNTLLVSTDPAHNLGDIFGRRIGGKITAINKYLSAIEIDAEQETLSYIEGVKQNLKGLVKSSLVEEVYRQIDTTRSSPGAEEAALFDRLISIILEESENYDTIIFDTAPTGHTIRLLTLPELMGVWIEGMLEKRKKTNKNYSQLLNDGEPIQDPIYDVLVHRKERFSQARNILLNPEKTGFVFVVNPERLPILETKKAIELLDSYHLHVKTIIVNKVLPDQSEGEFFTKRKLHEKQYLDWIKDEFKAQSIIKVPMFSEDITTTFHLRQFSSYIG